MSAPSKCPACAVMTFAPSTEARLHEGRIWHNACLIRSLQAELDTMRQLYEGLRPRVQDRSVLRGPSRFEDMARVAGYEPDEDTKNALEWLRRVTGRKT